MGHCITQNRLCLVDVIGVQVRMRLPMKKSGSLRFAAGRTPNELVMCARLPLAKTRPSAISPESAIIRLRRWQG
jgi:hypothetical protein